MTDDINHLPAETIKDLKLNHTYLISRYNTVSSAKILLITDKAYHIRWNGGAETWELKENVYNDFTLIEDISDFIIEMEFKPTILDVKTKLVQCHICHGAGTVPEPKSTAGNKVCPLCLGAKMIPEVTEINQK
jgi:hypothetical protein